MKDCVFCAIAGRELPASVVYEDALCLAFMDIHPLRPGHVLVVSRRHAQSLHQLTEEEQGHLLRIGSRIGQALKASSLAPAGFHFNINDGREAHQTVPHVHLHVLPRYRGDMAAFAASLLWKPVSLLTGGQKREGLDRLAEEIRSLLPTA